MRIIPENKDAISIAIEALQKGQLCFIATETVYIAAVDATNPEAVKKLISFKNRPFGKPFSVGVTDLKMAERYVHLNQNARKLYKQFLPGPLTVISNGKHTVAPGVEAENGTLGIRIPNYPFLLELIKKFKKPVTTTSANASYQRRPYQLSHILDNISEKQKKLIDLMIDAGTLPTREPSTVIDTTLDEPTTLRQGDIKLKDKNEVLSRSEENTQNLAKELWQKNEVYFRKKPIIFALEGQMGAGKTHFVKGLAKAIGVSETITSPSYDLLCSYNIKKSNTSLVHLDTWRMIDPGKEFTGLEIKKLLLNNDILAVEWAARIINNIKEYSDDAIIIWIKIEYGKNENDRIISWGNL